jgi:serine/threonine-protein kinase
VKPHNVLIGDDGGMLLADFGLARHVHGGVPYRTRTDQSMGTPNYRAPEQGVDAANVDLRADLYGAGATMFYLVTGRRPGFLFMVEPQDPEMDGVPEELKPFVLTCMAQRPEERYPDARACALALATVAERMDPGSASRDRWMARFDQLGRRSWLDRVLAWIRR